MKVIKYLVFLIIAFTALITELQCKGPNPYKVLGVSKDASQQQIKQGFKKRSKKYHPDRNKQDPRAKQKFEKIVNAYELLKDPERRRIYDMTGEDNPQGMPGGGFQQGGFQGGINIQDIMRQFGGFGGFGGGFGQPRGFSGNGRFHQGGQGQQGRQRRTYTFTMGGGAPGGMRFQF